MAATKPPPTEKPKSLKGRSKELIDRLAQVAKDDDPAKEKAFREHQEQRDQEQAAVYAAFHKNKKE